MFENPRRGRQAKTFTTTVPKILDLKSSSEQIFSENCRWVPLKNSENKPLHVLLVFSVTPFKIDQNKNQNRSIDKVQNLGNERRYVYKDPRQDSGQRNISHARYPKKYFTHAGAHLDELQHGGRKPTETSVTEFLYKSVNLFFEKLTNIKVILFLIHELFR